MLVIIEGLVKGVDRFGEGGRDDRPIGRHFQVRNTEVDLID